MVICSHCSNVNHPDNVVCSNCGMPLMPDPALDGDPYVGRTLGGRFTLQDIVGSGDLGMVYRGIDQRSGQAVAVKVVHPDVAATHGDALLNAARAVAQVRHAKIATVLGATRAPDGATFIVTEYLEGETLKTLLERNGPVSPRRTADILFQLCSALAPIHRAGRPHSNLKPENVFLVPRDEGDDFVKIVDAGYPDLFGVRETPDGTVIIGSPKFFSPEQALAQPVTLVSDQFTLGIIGYQLLTGALPFFGATPDQLLSAIANGVPTPVSQRTGGVPLPQRLETVIHRCLEKDPARRYPDLRSLATDLAAVIKEAQATSVPVLRPAVRPAFGSGLDLSTMVASPGMMASLGRPVDDDDDEDSTVARQLPVDIEALLASAGVSAPMANAPMANAPMANTPRSMPPPPTGNDLRAIPEPLMFTGALDSIDIQEALAAASRAAAPQPPVRSPLPPRPLAPPPTPAADAPFDIGAALAAAAAEVDGVPASRSAPRSAPPPPPPPGDFDPFAGLDLPPASSVPPPPPPPRSAPPGSRAAPPAGAARPSIPPGGPGLTSDIMSAIHEELDPRAVGAPIGASASPLATAADFAALSPDIITRARDVQANVEAADRRGALKRNYTTAAVAVLLLAVVGAAVWYFVFNNDEPTPVARQGAAGRGVASTPPTATPLPVPIDVQITSEPVGAQVFEGEVNLGVTPLTLTLSTTAQRTIRLAMEGHRSALQLVDPAALPVANPAGLLNFLIMLEPGEDPPAAPAAPASVAGSNPGTAPTSAVGDGAEADALAAVPGSKPDAGTEPERPSRTPATKGKSTRNRPKTPSSAAATPRSGGVARPAGGKAKPPRPQTDPSKIKDPFAED